MSDEFDANFAWQKKYEPCVRYTVGPLLLKPAPMELDLKEATDMMVFVARDMRIACRIRRAKYLKPYGWQFTIRSRMPSGHKTELQKLTEGWGDWMFYGFAADDNVPMLARWFVIDLHHWRAHMIRNTQRKNGGPLVITEKQNGDGSCLTAFDIRSFPDDPPLLVTASEAVPKLTPDMQLPFDEARA